MKWPESKDIVRDTFAVFMQPNFDVVMQLPRGKTETVPRESRFLIFCLIDVKSLLRDGS